MDILFNEIEMLHLLTPSFPMLAFIFFRLNRKSFRIIVKKNNRFIDRLMYYPYSLANTNK